MKNVWLSSYLLVSIMFVTRLGFQVTLLRAVRFVLQASVDQSFGTLEKNGV